MKQFRLVVLSLAALAFARPPGFCTANAAAEPPKDEGGKPPTQGERLAALEEHIARQDEELARLRAASPTALAADPLPGSLDLLLKGAGVEMKDVGWRIRAGLSHEQAVEVALNEKREREAAEADAKKGAKK